MLFNGTAAPLFSPDGSDWWRSRRQGGRGARGGSGGLWGAPGGWSGWSEACSGKERGCWKKMGGETDLFVAMKIKCLERAIFSWPVKEDFGLCRPNEWGLWRREAGFHAIKKFFKLFPELFQSRSHFCFGKETVKISTEWAQKLPKNLLWDSFLISSGIWGIVMDFWRFSGNIFLSISL